MESAQSAVPQLPKVYKQSVVFESLKETLAELLLAPLWWYSYGLLKVLKWWAKEVKQGAHRLSLRILVSHWFVPMYGQYDTAGRIISFFFRTLMLIWNFIMMIIWLVIVTAALIIYIALPPIAVWQLSANLAWQ